MATTLAPPPSCVSDALAFDALFTRDLAASTGLSEHRWRRLIDTGEVESLTTPSGVRVVLATAFWRWLRNHPEMMSAASAESPTGGAHAPPHPH